MSRGQESTDGAGEVGMVWLPYAGRGDLGCGRAADRVLERLEDGGMNLLVRGTRPFRVLERQGHLPYPAGVIEFVEDRRDTPDPELVDSARAAYADLVKRATDREPESEDLDQMGAYDMAATVDFGLDAKQGLL